MSPNEVARALGVSPSGLRRLAEIYSRVCEELPRDPASRARSWPETAVTELAAARRLVAAKRAASIGEALQAIRGGEVSLHEADDRLEGSEQAERYLALAADFRELRVESLALREALGELSRAISAVAGEVRAARGEVRERLGDSRSERFEGDAREVPQRAELRLLRRRLRYLEAELEMRDL